MKKQISVVNDDPSVNSIFEFILQQAGHNVIIYPTGEAFLSALDSGYKADLIFLDCKLSGISGVDTLKKVMEKNPLSLVIMLSSYVVEDVLKDAFHNGAYSVVYKPFDVEEVLMIVEKIFKMPALD